jgi:hypothetical protein
LKTGQGGEVEEEGTVAAEEWEASTPLGANSSAATPAAMPALALVEPDDATIAPDVLQGGYEHLPYPASRFRRWTGRAAAEDTEDRPREIAVSLVVPAMNEEHNIGWVLRRIPDIVDEVILVDGNSTDRTVAISQAIRPDILVITQGQPGKGAALRAGFAAARGDIVVMIDADRSMDPREIERFLDSIRAGYDLVKGSRFIPGGGTDDMERTRRFGNNVLRGLVNVLYRAEFSDLCYGYVAFQRDRLEDLALTADGFEIEAEIICRALRAGLRIAEVPSFEAPRGYGASNLNTWRDGTRVLRTLLSHRSSRRADPARPQAALPAAADA